MSFIETFFKLSDKVVIVTILSMYFEFLFFGKITGMQLIYMKKTHTTSMLTFLSVGINVPLNISLIIRFGAFGAACATLVVGLISGTIFFIGGSASLQGSL